MGDTGPGIDTNLGTIEEINTQGHMAVEGELHHDRRCRYVRFKATTQLAGGSGQTYTAYTLRRACFCSAFNGELKKRSELHFLKGCKWKRIEDTAYNNTTDQNVYVYRKCVCYLPEYEHL